jgi:hypothetical protein
VRLRGTKQSNLGVGSAEIGSLKARRDPALWTDPLAYDMSLRGSSFGPKQSRTRRAAGLLRRRNRSCL